MQMKKMLLVLQGVAQDPVSPTKSHDITGPCAVELLSLPTLHPIGPCLDNVLNRSPTSWGAWAMAVRGMAGALAGTCFCSYNAWRLLLLLLLLLKAGQGQAALTRPERPAGADVAHHDVPKQTTLLPVFIIALLL
jgi:hypothetical protein